MKGTLSNIIIFAVGAGVGVAATWKYFKTKYERMAQEEIEAVREFYEDKATDAENDDVNKRDVDVKNDEAYVSTLKRCGYVDKSEEVTDLGKPVVISPVEFAENVDDFDIVSLNYYADGVLTDQYDQIIEDVESIVGYDALTRFGEYEEDTVYVKNARDQQLYEVLYDESNYYDVPKMRPHQTEDE